MAARPLTALLEESEKLVTRLNPLLTLVRRLARLLFPSWCACKASTEQRSPRKDSSAVPSGARVLAFPRSAVNSSW